MTKAEAMALATKYNMEILRHPVTNEAWAIQCNSKELIPELDKLTDSLCLPCTVTRKLFCEDTYIYTLVCPKTWFDLYGWKGKES
jgi:hypothetical protein